MQANWKKWVLNNLLRGVPWRDIYSTLIQSGFTHTQAASVLGQNIPASELGALAQAERSRYPQPAFIQSPPESPDLTALGGHKAALYTVQNFLAEEDCDAIVALSKQHLRPSTITTGDDDEVRTFRTSSTCDLLTLSDQLAKKVSDHICHYFGFTQGADEPIQAQHYQEGQEFKAHTDYFEPGTQEFTKYAGSLGQRTWTCMVYLNDVSHGGETDFVNLGISITPKKAMAVIWNNLYETGEPNPDTLHHARPVIKGEKSVITQWFRTAR